MKELKIVMGDKIELRPKLPDGSYSSAIFASKIQDVLSEKEFLILPLDKKDLAAWIGKVFELTVIRKNEVYVSDAEIIGVTREKSLDFFRLAILGVFARNQRRSYYRLKIYLEVEVLEHGKFKTIDISGKGMAFISDKNIPKYEKIEIAINLEGDIVNVSGTVLRCVDVSIDDSTERFLVCVEFKYIEKEVQNKILQFIYKKQRIMIGNGVLASSKS